MTEEEARKQVKERKSFYSHLTSFVVVNLVLVAIDLLTSPGELWFFWPLLGWSIGLVIHAARVYGFGAPGKEWEDRKVRELMVREGDYVTAGDLEQRLHERSRRAKPVDTERLVRRIEHLEAIVTSRDWEHGSRPGSDDAEAAADRAQRLE